MEKVLFYFQPGARSGFYMGPCTDLIWVVKLSGLIAYFLIFYLGRSRRPLGATYWLAVILPGLVGVVMGLYMFDLFNYEIGRAGYIGPLPPEYYVIRAVFVMHYGLFLSALLFLVIFYLYVRRVLFSNDAVRNGDPDRSGGTNESSPALQCREKGDSSARPVRDA